MTSLPTGWTTRRLDEIAEVKLGRQRSPKNHTGTHMRPYLRAANVTWQGLDLSDVKHMNFTDAELANHRLEPGDVLLSEASGSPSEVGKAALWRGEIADCAFQNTLLRVRAFDADPAYLRHYFHHLAVSGHFSKSSRGVGIHHLGRAALASQPVPVPPLVEQRRIVDLLEDHSSRLDAADTELIRVRARLGLLREIQLHMRFAGAEGDEVTLGEIARWGSGGTPRAGSPAYYEGGSIPWVVSGELKDEPLSGAHTQITEAGLKESSAKWVPAGAVLVAMYGATIGKLATTLAPVTTNQAVAHAVPLETYVSVEYLFWYLRSQRRHLVAAGKGGAQPNISQTVLKAWPLRLPPKGVQAAAVQEAEQLQDLIARLDGQITIARRRAVSLRRALLAAAFSGRLSTASAVSEGLHV